MMNPVAAREDFNQALRIIHATFNPNNDPNVNVADKFRMTQSDVRLEQPYLTNTSFTFPVLNNISNLSTGGQFNTEIRLAQQDIFVPFRIGFFLALPSSPTDTTFNLFPYASPFIFTNATAMEAIYAGKMTMTMQNDVLMKNYSMRRHRKTNQTQQTSAYGAGSPLDQLDSFEDGFQPFQPFILLRGSEDIQITINLPLPATAVDTNARLVLWLGGILVQNSTPVN